MNVNQRDSIIPRPEFNTHTHRAGDKLYPYDRELEPLWETKLEFVPRTDTPFAKVVMKQEEAIANAILHSNLGDHLNILKDALLHENQQNATPRNLMVTVKGLLKCLENDYGIVVKTEKVNGNDATWATTVDKQLLSGKRLNKVDDAEVREALTRKPSAFMDSLASFGHTLHEIKDPENPSDRERVFLRMESQRFFVQIAEDFGIKRTPSKPRPTK